MCELLFDGYLPASGSGPGHFYDVLKNETKMARLFERFVLNFAKRHCRDASVRAMQIKWSGTWDESVAKVLPIMQTDVAIEYQDRKAILDCKYYRDALVSRDGRNGSIQLTFTS